MLRPAGARGPAGLAAREAIAIGGLVLALFAPLAAFGANTSLFAAFTALAHLAIALAIVLLLGWSVAPPLWRAAAPVAVAVFCVLVWGALGLTNEPRADWAQAFRRATAADAHSLAPDATLLELVKLSSLAALGLAATIVGARGERLRLCAMLIVAAGGVYGLVSLAMHQNNPMEVFGVNKGSHAGRFTATLLNPNAAGCLFAMLCVIAAGLLSAHYNRLRALAPALRSAAWPGLALLLVAVAFFLGACALTKSRAALAAGAGAVILLLLLRQSPWRRRGGRGLTPRAAAVLAAGLALAVVISGAGALHRAADLSSAAADRLEAFRHYVELAAAAPLTGYGLGSFPLVGLHGLDPAEAAHMWNFRAAHNAPLQAVLEGGWPYLGFLLAALGLWIAAGARPARAGVRSVRMGLALAAGVAAACGMVDIALQVPAIAAFAVVALGLSVGAGFDAAIEGKPLRNRSPIAPRRPSPAAP